MNNSSTNGTGLSIREVFRALKHRNYRLFFIGQGLSLIGTWVQSVAVGWLVYSMSHSALLLGIVGFSGQIASVFLAPFAGVWIDRWNKHRLLLTTQTLFMIQAFAFAVLAMTGLIKIWHVIVLSLFSGCVNGFDTPTRQAFVVDMIDDRSDLGNAIALNSSMFNSARLLGPAAAGFLIATLGESACFLINGFSYLAVLIALLAMRVPPNTNSKPKNSVFYELKEGYSYTFGFPPVRAVILILALVSFVSMPSSILLPVFASKILGGGAKTLGFLSSAAGLGALIGAVFLAARKSVLGLGRWIPAASIILGAGMIGFSLSRFFGVSLALQVAVGFGTIVQMASCNTILQTIVDDNVRGRVMSYYTMAFLGMTPFGSLLSGVVANRIGAPQTILAGGVIAIFGAVLFAYRLPSIRRLVHPIYCEKGILPPYLCALQSASEMPVPPEHI